MANPEIPPHPPALDTFTMSSNISPLSFPDGDPPDPMKRTSRKRASNDQKPISKAKRNKLTLSTPSPTPCPKLQRHRPAKREPALSEPKPLKRARSTYKQTDRPTDQQANEISDCDLAPSSKRFRHGSESARNTSEPQIFWSSINDWVEKTPWAESVQKKVESGEILQTIEEPFSAAPGPDLQADGDVDNMSQRDGETIGPESTTGRSSEKLNTSSPLYRGTLKMNNVIIDDFGDMMPPDVRQLVTVHVRKDRRSPKLEDDQKNPMKQTIREVWDSSEPMISDIIIPPLFPVKHHDIAEGRDTIWSTLPLPRNVNYAYALPAPKTDRHFGFLPTRKSNWTAQELSAADHPKVRPYSQPTPANMFPCFLMELKSETTGGTLYSAEGQLASSGAHRVNSLIWTLDQVDASRKRSSADAIVFSAAVSQREAVVHVHYFNPENNKFYMSWLDTFTYAKDGIQECHDFIKNVVEWMVDIQQPMLKQAMDELHPITRLWKKRGTISTPIDGAESFTSENERPSKSQRTEG